MIHLYILPFFTHTQHVHIIYFVPGADTGGCTSCMEDRRISRSKFRIASFSDFVKSGVCDSLSNFVLCSQASTRRQRPKCPVAEPCCYVSVQ